MRVYALGVVSLNNGRLSRVAHINAKCEDRQYNIIEQVGHAVVNQDVVRVLLPIKTHE